MRLAFARKALEKLSNIDMYIHANGEMYAHVHDLQTHYMYMYIILQLYYVVANTFVRLRLQ